MTGTPVLGDSLMSRAIQQWPLSNCRHHKTFVNCLTTCYSFVFLFSIIAEFFLRMWTPFLGCGAWQTQPVHALVCSNASAQAVSLLCHPLRSGLHMPSCCCQCTKFSFRGTLVLWISKLSKLLNML